VRWDEKTLRALPPGLTMPEMAQRLGVDYVWSNAQLIGQYGFYRRACVQKVRMAEMRALAPNLTLRQVAERLGIAPVRMPNPIRVMRQRQFAPACGIAGV